MANRRTSSIGRGTSNYQRIARELRESAEPVCHLCGEPIDLGLPARHPKSWSADHLIPLHQGGAPEDIENLAPAHYGCNSARGARDLANRVECSRMW